MHWAAAIPKRSPIVFDGRRWRVQLQFSLVRSIGAFAARSVRHCAADLAALLSMSFAYAPEFGFSREQREFSSFFGNAILSAAPLENVRIVPLADAL